MMRVLDDGLGPHVPVHAHLEFPKCKFPNQGQPCFWTLAVSRCFSALNLTTQRPKLQGFKPAVRRDSMLHVVRVRKHVVHRHGRWVRVIYVALYSMYDVHTAKNKNAGPVDLSCQLGAAGRSRARRRRASPDTRRPSSLQRDRYTFSIPTRCSGTWQQVPHAVLRSTCFRTGPAACRHCTCVRTGAIAVA